jgi:ADP-heptose:LPS heptosyltransferase
MIQVEHRLVQAPPLQPAVLYFARLGDMVILTAMLALLHRRFGRPCHVIGAGSWVRGVFQGNPDVARVWTFGRHLPFMLSGAWPEVRRALRESDPAPIYICEHNHRQLPRIRRMLFLCGIDLRRCVFVSEDPQTLHHSVDRLVRLGEKTPDALSAGDYPVPGSGLQWAPRLCVSAADQADLEKWLCELGWAGRRIVLVQPGNHRSMSRRRGRWARMKTDDKAWPTQRWVTLLQRVHSRLPDALILLRGTQEELDMLQGIQAATGLDCVVVAETGLRRLFALCGIAHSMISVDAGPAHAAAALGLPVTVMYGAGPQRFWLPRSGSGSPVIGVGGPPESMRVDQLSVEAVFNAWCTLLEQREEGSMHLESRADRPAVGRS